MALQHATFRWCARGLFAGFPQFTAATTPLGNGARLLSSAPAQHNGGDAAPLDLPPNLKLSIKCKQLIRAAQAPPQPPPKPTFQVPVIDLLTGNTVDTVELDESIFGHEVRRDVVHAVVRWQLACRRRGLAKTKKIGEVSGSGQKMRPQKGSGRARCGHKRPPHWRGGARAHGPRGNRDWSYKLHKKVRLMGLRSVLSAKLVEGKLFVADAFAVESRDHAAAIATLRARGWLDSALLVDGEDPTQPEFAFVTQHLKGMKLLWGGAANCYDVLRRDRLVLSRAGLRFLTNKLTR